ncbi:MAG: hypothetical protein MUO64_06595 [Anaerolineales bacterium]|nr:hypothetical protein [Anaerolineales bacterium]
MELSSKYLCDSNVIHVEENAQASIPGLGMKIKLKSSTDRDAVSLQI